MEGVFSEGELWDADLEWIEHNAVELESALDNVADELTTLVEPNATEVLTIDELLARFMRKGLVGKEVVPIASRLIECLGTSNSNPGGGGLAIGDELDPSELKALVGALRKVVNFYEKKTAP